MNAIFVFVVGLCVVCVPLTWFLIIRMQLRRGRKARDENESIPIIDYRRFMFWTVPVMGGFIPSLVNIYLEKRYGAVIGVPLFEWEIYRLTALTWLPIIILGRPEDLFGRADDREELLHKNALYLGIFITAFWCVFVNWSVVVGFYKHMHVSSTASIAYMFMPIWSVVFFPFVYLLTLLLSSVFRGPIREPLFVMPTTKLSERVVFLGKGRMSRSKNNKTRNRF